MYPAPAPPSPGSYRPSKNLLLCQTQTSNWILNRANYNYKLQLNISIQKCCAIFRKSGPASRPGHRLHQLPPPGYHCHVAVHVHVVVVIVVVVVIIVVVVVIVVVVGGDIDHGVDGDEEEAEEGGPGEAGGGAPGAGGAPLLCQEHGGVGGEGGVGEEGGVGMEGMEGCGVGGGHGGSVGV